MTGALEIYLRGLWRRVSRPSRLASNDMEGAVMLGLVALAIATAFIAAGMLAIYMVKRHARMWFRQGGISMLAGYLASACVAMLAGSVVSWLFVRPRSVFGSELVIPWETYLESGGYFFAVTLIAVTGAVVIEAVVRRTWLARLSEFIGVTTMAAIFALWPIVRSPAALFADPWRTVSDCIAAAVHSFSYLLSAAFENPFVAVWNIVQAHGGNQFELAEYYPGLLLMLLVASGVGALFHVGSSAN